MTEPTYPCPKCGAYFPMSQLHAHYQTCQGTGPKHFTYPNQALTQFPQSLPQQAFPQYPTVPTPQPSALYVPPPKPVHQHRWSENNTYKVCIAYLYDASEECREIKVKLRGSWQIFVRYGFKLFWIQMIIALAIAFSIASAFGVHK